MSKHNADYVSINPSQIKTSIQEEDITLSSEIQPVSFCSLFKFATPLDTFYMIVGSFSAIIVGLSKPLFQVLFGKITDTFAVSKINPDYFISQSTLYLYYFIIIGVIIFVFSWLMLSLWMIAGDRQALKCRQIYLNSLISQEIGWYDRTNQSQLATKFATQTFAFQNAIGQKIPTIISIITLTIAGFLISFYIGWQLTLVMMVTLPVTIAVWYFYITMIQQKQLKVQSEYSDANGKAQEVLASIKTVKSLNGQKYQTKTFSEILDKIVEKVYTYFIFSSIAMGCQFCILCLCQALAVWYGSDLINDRVTNFGKPYTAGDTMTILMLVLSGGQNLSQIIPCLKKFSEGQVAAGRIYAIINRKPKIYKNPFGKKLFNLKGIIEFHNVTFAYPKKPNQVILNNISFKIQPNVTNALVGQSGCGKSTIMQLIMRFYDPDHGKITLDGIDLKQYDLSWLRSHVGYVGQEPVLFATTIKQNLLFGKPNATEQQIVQALKKAQAFDFVDKLQKKLQTYVGYGGSQLSGGQKQRLAIARAILKNPKILLLDQATSALDRKNQKLIQNTLDRLSTGRTTISIAHRIKSIMNAQSIFVIQDGKLKQKGKFQQLQRFRGIKYEQKQYEQQEIEKQKKTFKKTQNQLYFEKLKKQQQQKKQQMQLIKKYQQNAFSRLISYSKPDLLVLIIGSIFSLLNGCLFPFLSIFLSKLVIMLAQLQVKSDSVTPSQINQIVVVFVIVAAITLFTHTFQYYIFSILAQKLTTRLRIQCFAKMLKMPVPWYDEPKHNSGTLTARLATDCRQVNGLIQNIVGLTLQNIGCLVSGLIIAFLNQWRVSLVTLALLPFIIGAAIIHATFSVGFSAQTDQAYKDSSNLIMQSMINIRTVTSFGVQNSIQKKYIQKLQQPKQLSIRKGNISGALYGLSQCIMFVIFGLIFWICSLLIKSYGVTFQQVFNVIYTIMMITFVVGGNSQLMPDMGSSQNSAANLFQILDSVDQDQLQITSNSSKLTNPIKNGHIQIKNIAFKYPNRQIQVFRNLSLTIKPGSKVAFVGASGCGKSTIIQMLMRFYDPIEGQITLDGIPLKQYDIHYLRSLYGVVSQQPVLFNTSIIKNIQYNIQNPTLNQITEAAKKANALSFIETNYDDIVRISKTSQDLDKTHESGFHRSVGVRGSQLSGGQKQRIAIARAILRNPKILLLDEATSALDSKNQKVVQQSLDILMKGLTTITIAHRIQTIKNSNTIYVFDHGKIVEQGSYDQLIRKKGFFYQLQKGTQHN